MRVRVMGMEHGHGVKVHLDDPAFVHVIVIK